VRVHLRRLESEGVVEPALERPPRGRPVARYRLTPRADAEFPERYELFASRFVESVIRLQGAEAFQRVLAEWENALHAWIDERLPKPPDERLRALARQQTEHGFMAAVRTDDGGVSLVEHNCPILELARRHPEICAMEASLYSRVLRWKTTLSACRASGADACVFQIGRRRGPKSDPETAG
jgi:predicted ArsR family transcriptional regulator